jgi:hypothetical protein
MIIDTEKYVEATGGKLHIDIELEDGTHYCLPI